MSFQVREKRRIIKKDEAELFSLRQLQSGKSEDARLEVYAVCINLIYLWCFKPRLHQGSFQQLLLFSHPYTEKTQVKNIIIHLKQEEKNVDRKSLLSCFEQIWIRPFYTSTSSSSAFSWSASLESCSIRVESRGNNKDILFFFSLCCCLSLIEFPQSFGMCDTVGSWRFQQCFVCSVQTSSFLCQANLVFGRVLVERQLNN